MKLVTVAEMRAIEKEADAAGLSYARMMENAGLGCAALVDDRFGAQEFRSVVGLVGSGNNGGDTLIALAELARRGWSALAFLAQARPKDELLVGQLEQAGGSILAAAEDPDSTRLEAALEGSAVLLDGLLGTGARLPLAENLAGVLKIAGQYGDALWVVAIDCPSGVDCDSGQTAPETLTADLTLCMAAVKIGLLKFPAFEHAGEIVVVPIGTLDDLVTWQGVQRFVAAADAVAQALPERKADAHKGTFGTAMIVAGSINYTGAALLSASAAYRSGAGLVRLAVPGPLHAPLSGHLPEVTWLLLPHQTGVIAEDAYDLLRKNLERVTALLVGPGLGLEDTTAEFMRRLVENKAEHGGHSAFGFPLNNLPGITEPASTTPKQVLPPLVIDADGLKLLAEVDKWYEFLPAPAVLTPHPGEMAILTGESLESIQANRFSAAVEWAHKWGHVVVLKGAVTLIAAPDGHLAVIPVATAALARAGTGDVLAGLICGLRAQGLPAFEAAWTGAWIHAQAGLRAAAWLGKASVLASDVLHMIPEVLEELEGKAPNDSD